MVLAALLLAAFVINLDTTLINVALPTLVRELHATTTQLQWVVDAYNLVFAALLLTCGALSDRIGRKGMLLAGLAVFGAASVAGSFAASPGWLITARAVMGLGAAMTFPATLSLISNVFTGRAERARAIGLWGAIGGVAIAFVHILRAQNLGLVGLSHLDHAEQSRRHIHQMFAFLLGFVERPLIVRLGPMDDRGGVRTVRGNGDEGQNDADHSNHHAHALGKGIPALLMRGMDFDFSHRLFPR